MIKQIQKGSKFFKIVICLVISILLVLCSVGYAELKKLSPKTQPVPSMGQVTLEMFPVWMKNQLNSLEWKIHKGESRLLTRKILRESFKAGRQFLINNQKAKGNFNYQYDFVKKRQSTGDSQVRQAGALWGLALMYQYEQDAGNRNALEKGLKFFFDHTREGPVKGSLLIAYPGASFCKTGTVALTALSIIEYLRTEKAGRVKLTDEYRKTLIRKLDGYIEHLKFLRLGNKHFSDSYDLRHQRKRQGFSPYFDGETMLCLIKAAKYLGYAELIPLIEDSAIVMAKYYTADQWQKYPDSKKTKGFFQWSCMAFYEYQDAGWKNAEVFGDYVLSLAWWMIHTHRTLKRTRNTAYAYEGIIPAYQLARSRKHKVRAA